MLQLRTSRNTNARSSNSRITSKSISFTRFFTTQDTAPTPTQCISTLLIDHVLCDCCSRIFKYSVSLNSCLRINCLPSPAIAKTSYLLSLSVPDRIIACAPNLLAKYSHRLTVCGESKSDFYRNETYHILIMYMSLCVSFTTQKVCAKQAHKVPLEALSYMSNGTELNSSD